MFRTLATASVLLVTLSLLAAEPKKEEKPAARELFNGKSLDGWKAVDFVNAGKLHVKDGNLVMDKGKSMTGCVYTRKDFPKSDYEVTFEGKKVEGNDFFCTTTFPVGDSFCSLVVGGWGGGVVGISSINGADGLIIDDSDNIWVCANQSDEIVVVEPVNGKVIAKLGDFDGIDNKFAARGLLFPASLVFSGQFVLVTNLVLDTTLFGFPTVDSQWARQVMRYTVSKINRNLPPTHGDDD